MGNAGQPAETEPGEAPMAGGEEGGVFLASPSAPCSSLRPSGIAHAGDVDAAPSSRRHGGSPLQAFADGGERERHRAQCAQCRRPRGEAEFGLIGGEPPRKQRIHAISISAAMP